MPSSNHTGGGLRTRGTGRARQRCMSARPEHSSRRRASTATRKTLLTAMPVRPVAPSTKWLSRARPRSASSGACPPERRLLMRGRGIAPVAYRQYRLVPVPSPYFLSTSVEAAWRIASREAPLQPLGSGTGQRSGNRFGRWRSGVAQGVKRVRSRTGTSSWRTKRRGLGAACTVANTGSGREVRSRAPRSQALSAKLFIFQLPDLEGRHPRSRSAGERARTRARRRVAGRGPYRCPSGRLWTVSRVGRCGRAPRSRTGRQGLVSGFQDLAPAPRRPDSSPRHAPEQHVGLSTPRRQRDPALRSHPPPRRRRPRAGP